VFERTPLAAWTFVRLRKVSARRQVARTYHGTSTAGLPRASERKSLMAPDPTAVCREVHNQLRRIEAHQGHDRFRVAADLPFNLSVFLGHFAGYIKWAERNTRLVEIASRAPPSRFGRNGDVA
jgi:hypothetical protein